MLAALAGGLEFRPGGGIPRRRRCINWEASRKLRGRFRGAVSPSAGKAGQRGYKEYERQRAGRGTARRGCSVCVMCVWRVRGCVWDGAVTFSPPPLWGWVEGGLSCGSRSESVRWREKSNLDKMSRQLSWFLGGTPGWGLGRGSCPLDSGPEREERVFNLRPAEVEVRTRNISIFPGRSLERGTSGVGLHYD